MATNLFKSYVKLHATPTSCLGPTAYKTNIYLTGPPTHSTQILDGLSPPPYTQYMTASSYQFNLSRNQIHLSNVYLTFMLFNFVIV